MSSPGVQVEELARVLTHPNEMLRAGAAMALGRLGARQAVELLEPLLVDDSPLVRESAARGLGQLGLPAVGSLLAMLQNPPSPEIPALVTLGLGSVCQPEAVNLLCAALEYPEPEARLGAAEALGHIGDPAAIPALVVAARHAHNPTRRAACQALGRLGVYHPQAMQAATALLREEDWQLRLVAVQTVGQLARALASTTGSPASAWEADFTASLLQPLLTILQDDVAEIRAAAATALVELRHPSIVEPLLAMRYDASAWIRQVVAEALGASENPALIPPLYELANEDGDIEVRMNAARALVQLGDPRGRGMLLRTINAPNAFTRQVAAVGLGLAGDLRAVEPLLKGVSEKEIRLETPQGRYLYRRSQDALAAVGEPAVPLLVKALRAFAPETRKIAFAALVQMGARALPELLKAYEIESDRKVRTLLVQVLGQIRSPEVIGPLSDTAGQVALQNHFFWPLWFSFFDPGVDERREAVIALGKIGTQPVARTLLAVARYDPDEAIRYQASLALARVGDPEAVLAFANTGIFPHLYRALLGGIFLIVAGGLAGLVFRWIEYPQLAWLTGLLVGAGFGINGGFTARKRVLQFTAGGLVASLLILPIGLSFQHAGTGFSVIIAVLLALCNAIPPYLARRQASLFERLAGLFFGMVLGFLSAGAGTLLLGIF